MNPTDQPPSAEAVKAAFEYVNIPVVGHASEKWRKTQDLSGYIQITETPDQAAARIMAAHARAKDSEVARLREALETELSIKKERLIQLRSYLKNNPQYWENLDGFVTHLEESSKRIDKALTGEASA